MLSRAPHIYAGKSTNFRSCSSAGETSAVVDATTGEEVGWWVVDFIIETVGWEQGVLQHTVDAYIEPSIAASYREVSGRLHYGGCYALRNVMVRKESVGEAAKENLLRNDVKTERRKRAVYRGGLYDRKLLDM